MDVIRIYLQKFQATSTVNVMIIVCNYSFSLTIIRKGREVSECVTRPLNLSLTP